jgi:hypothetical protein
MVLAMYQEIHGLSLLAMCKVPQTWLPDSQSNPEVCPESMEDL